METPTVKKIRVLWVDDSDDLLELYECIFMGQEDFQSVGFLPTQHDLDREIAHRCPDVVVLDLSMPGRPPLEVMEECIEKFPDVQFLVLSAHDDSAIIEHAMAAGATGYKVKDGDIDGLIGGLRQSAEGKKVVPRKG